ncbi:uncharacterized protein LOC141595486 [Silene latifolia]|uniref:uncharacterized protein LOC141595486 n=1 Tax=Silene latifolia TaxID=37657 RepID=UPI003D7880FA
MEYLSRILGVVAQHEDFRFHPLCGHLRLNHLLFADDLLLFCKGNEQSIMWILRSFATFSAASGLSLNKSKSEIYFNGVAPSIVKDILQIGLWPELEDGEPGTYLMQAGSHWLITSVLTSLHSYWASIFLIPSAIINRITAICRNFLWSGSSEYQKAPSINWDTCCLPKEEGGLGIKDVKCWNKALLGKYAWWLASKKDHLLVKWVNHVYLKGAEWSNYTPPPDCSWSWRKIIHIMQVFHQAYTDSKWLNADVPYTVQSGYHWLRLKAPKVEWRHICWNQLNVPKYSFIFWSFMHSRLLTKDRLVRMGITVDPMCDICRLHPEDHHHLFYACEYALACSRILQKALGISLPGPSLIQWFSRARRSKFQRRWSRSFYLKCTLVLLEETATS